MSSVVDRTLSGDRSCVFLVERIKQLFNDQQVKYKNGKHSGNDFFFKFRIDSRISNKFVLKFPYI